MSSNHAFSHGIVLGLDLKYGLNVPITSIDVPYIVEFCNGDEVIAGIPAGEPQSVKIATSMDIRSHPHVGNVNRLQGFASGEHHGDYGTVGYFQKGRNLCSAASAEFQGSTAAPIFIMLERFWACSSNLKDHFLGKMTASGGPIEWGDVIPEIPSFIGEELTPALFTSNEVYDLCTCDDELGLTRRLTLKLVVNIKYAPFFYCTQLFNKFSIAADQVVALERSLEGVRRSHSDFGDLTQRSILVGYDWIGKPLRERFVEPLEATNTWPVYATDLPDLFVCDTGPQATAGFLAMLPIVGHIRLPNSRFVQPRYRCHELEPFVKHIIKMIADAHGGSMTEAMKNLACHSLCKAGFRGKNVWDMPPLISSKLEADIARDVNSVVIALWYGKSFDRAVSRSGPEATIESVRAIVSQFASSVKAGRFHIDTTRWYGAGLTTNFPHMFPVNKVSGDDKTLAITCTGNVTSTPCLRAVFNDNGIETITLLPCISKSCYALYSLMDDDGSVQLDGASHTKASAGALLCTIIAKGPSVKVPDRFHFTLSERVESVQTQEPAPVIEEVEAPPAVEPTGHSYSPASQGYVSSAAETSAMIMSFAPPEHPPYSVQDTRFLRMFDHIKIDGINVIFTRGDDDVVLYGIINLTSTIVKDFIGKVFETLDVTKITIRRVRTFNEGFVRFMQNADCAGVDFDLSRPRSVPLGASFEDCVVLACHGLEFVYSESSPNIISQGTLTKFVSIMARVTKGMDRGAILDSLATVVDRTFAQGPYCEDVSDFLLPHLFALLPWAGRGYISNGTEVDYTPGALSFV